MSYSTNVPQSGQSLGQTQAKILGNFGTIQSGFSANHGAFGASNVGKHLFMQMPEQGSDPTTAVDEGALYTKLSRITADGAQMFYRNESSGAVVQLTGSGGTIPTILSGTATLNTTVQPGIAITGALPQNIYGYIIMWSTVSPFPVQMGTFFTDTTDAHGYSDRIKQQGTGDDYPVELTNAPGTSDLTLYGTKGNFGNLTINWRLMYWAQ
jgi:hypothetical protein